jgi:hypothetical protein
MLTELLGVPENSNIGGVKPYIKVRHNQIPE